MKKYYESEQSKKIIELNREYVTLKKDPKKIIPMNAIEKIWKYSFIIARYLHRNIFSRHLYDTKSELKEGEYDNIVYPIEYESIPKIVVYTCITGSYDNLEEPVYVNDNISYCAITDFDIPNSSRWQRMDIKKIQQIDGYDNIQKARYVKTHPHELFGDFDYSIWIDGNIVLMADLIPLVLTMEKNNTIFGCHIHPHRRKLITEAKAIIKLKRKVVKEKLKEQIDFYYSQGYKDQVPVYETTILIRKHNDKQCISLMQEWWNQIYRYTTRDQISLPYVIWEKQFQMHKIESLGCNLKLNPRFRYREHR